VRAAALRNGRHGKREQSDCGAEHHAAILRPIEPFFRVARPGASLRFHPDGDFAIHEGFR
jgi:hypothetical protein